MLRDAGHAAQGIELVIVHKIGRLVDRGRKLRAVAHGVELLRELHGYGKSRVVLADAHDATQVIVCVGVSRRRIAGLNQLAGNVETEIECPLAGAVLVQPILLRAAVQVIVSILDHAAVAIGAAG
jgi:hypothetical protein